MSAAGDPGTALPPGTAQIKIYRTRGAPTSATYPNGPFYVAASVTPTPNAWGGAAAWDDFVSDASLGAAIPTTNTALAAMGTIAVTVPIGGAGVTDRKIYRTVAGGSALKLLGPVGNNTATVANDGQPDSALGAAPPITNTAGAEYHAVQLSNIATGPAAVTNRKVYRTVVNGAQLKLLWPMGDNTTTTLLDQVADAGLGINAPTGDTSGLQQVPGQVPAGSASMVVANAGVFQAAGGWAVIGNGEQVVRYTATTANSLTGLPPLGIGAITAAVAYNSTVTAAPLLTGVAGLTAALVKGDEVYLVVRRDDAARQTALAAMVHVGPGIREEWVQDRRLAIPEARARGDATLALRPLEDVTITYRCRDLRTASGKTITVNLPAPTNLSGSYKIQHVTIGNFRPYPTQYPTYTVTASSRRFSFEDWLRRMETST